MNRKGAVLFIVIFAIAYFMFGMILYQFLKPDITIQRDSEHLKCSAPDTSGDKAICLILDGVIPLFVIGILSATSAYITSEAIR